MNPFLVTGGAGFIGSNFVHLALARGLGVVNLDALTYAGNPANLDGAMDAEGHIFVHGSINDGGLLERLMAEHRPSAVLNFAAESHVDRSIDAPEDFLRTNVDGTFRLLEAARAHWRRLADDERRAFRFLHVSTDEVFGSIDEGRAAEDAAYAPNSPYAATKAAADHLVRAYNRTYGLPTLITNCGNNYGPRQFPEKLVPHLIVNALEGLALPVYGDGLQVRDWIHVEDHCRALLRVLEAGAPGETYNVGGDEERPNLEVVETLCRALDELRPRANGAAYSELISFVADRPGHDRRYALDARKIARDLDWRPQVAFEDGIRRTVGWYLDNRPWWEDIRSGVYRGDRLGLGRGAGAA